jgi:hypothetical protein
VTIPPRSPGFHFDAAKSVAIKAFSRDKSKQPSEFLTCSPRELARWGAADFRVTSVGFITNNYHVKT